MLLSTFSQVVFSPVNAPLSILLIISIIYWLFTIVGGMDYDLDLDMDFDADGIDNPDGTVDIPDEPSAFIQFLKFLNLDVIPVTLFFTLTILFTWLISIYLSMIMPMPTWIGLLAIIPGFWISMMLTKFVTIPLRGFFKTLNHKGEESYDFLGAIGLLQSNLENDRMGTLEVYMDKDPIKLMVKSKDGIKLTIGDKVMICDEDPDKKFYYVEKSHELS